MEAERNERRGRDADDFGKADAPSPAEQPTGSGALSAAFEPASAVVRARNFVLSRSSESHSAADQPAAFAGPPFDAVTTTTTAAVTASNAGCAQGWSIFEVKRAARD